MKLFQCDCGQQTYFDNIHCTRCGKHLGFDPITLDLLSLEEIGTNTYAAAGRRFKYCQNQLDYNVCNWLLDANSTDRFCLSCDLNEIIPQVTDISRRQWWYRMEKAKRRLMYGLIKLRLPLTPRYRSANGLAFAFLEDHRMNPGVEHELINTGHAHGLITIYLAEADDVAREQARLAMDEKYRTLLGHFRHESGHYFFDRLVKGSEHHAAFKRCFGDDSRDYTQSLQAYYRIDKYEPKNPDFISRYAQSHPLEDWAETWAHYLHLLSGTETAFHLGLVQSDPYTTRFEKTVADWPVIARIVNQLNQSMGLNDAYPFILTSGVIEKLHFIDQLISARRWTS